MLRHAGNFISRLPKAEHDAHGWQVAMQALLLVVEHGGDPMSRTDRDHARAASASRAGADEEEKTAKKYKIVR